MLKFILYNHFFEFLIIGIAAINFILLQFIEKNESKSKIEKENLDTITKCKLTSVWLTLVICSLLILFFAKKVLLSLAILFIPSISFIKSIKNIYTDNNDFSLDNKYAYTGAAIFFIIFLSAYVTPVYITSFSIIDHVTKEIVILFYLVIKLVSFVFLLSINLTVLLSNITILLESKNFKIKNTIQNNNNTIIKFISYDFILYKKYKTTLTKIVDNIIFFMLCLPTILINIIYITFLKLLKKLKLTLYKIFNYITNDTVNKLLFTRKITNISIIAALIIVYLITVINKSLFSEDVLKGFDFLSTVIIIPFIYDSIKTKSQQ